MSKKFLFVVLSAYLILEVLLLVHHELWGEEIQAFLIITKNSSLPSVLNLLHYESHQALWYLILFATLQLSHAIWLMQFVHLMIALACAGIFLRYTPFGKVFKILFLFGYFPFYEYAVISRNYSLSVLFIFIFCYLYRERRANYLAITFCLFLLFQTSMMGLLVGIGLSALFVYSLLQKRNYKKLFTSLAIIFFGAVLSLVQIWPAADARFQENTYLHFSLERFVLVVSSIWRGYFPIPPFDYNFWRYNVLIPNFQKITSLSFPNIFGIILSFFSSCALFVFWIKKLDKYRPIQIYFILSHLLLLLFFYTRMFGYVRHYGFLYIILVSSLWIGYETYAKEKIAAFLMGVILVAQLYSGLFAGIMDYKYPFSESKSVAEYIQSTGFRDLPVIGDFDYSVMPLSYYLDRSTYYPRREDFGTYIRLDSRRDQEERIDLAAFAKNFVDREQKNSLLVSTYPVEDTRILPLKEFTNSMNREENYYLYLVRASDL